MAVNIIKYRGIVGCTTQPEDKYVLWLDISNSSKPVLKIYINGGWVQLADSKAESISTLQLNKESD